MGTDRRIMEAQIIKWIQSFSHPILDDVFQVVTMLGEELFIIVAMALIYWVFNKEMGKYLCYSLCVTLCVNGIIKSLVKAPRPIGEEGIRSLRVETADGYSFPSGHTQSSSTFFFSVACWIKKWWLFLIAAGVRIRSKGRFIHGELSLCRRRCSLSIHIVIHLLKREEDRIRNRASCQPKCSHFEGQTVYIRLHCSRPV